MRSAVGESGGCCWVVVYFWVVSRGSKGAGGRYGLRRACSALQGGRLFLSAAARSWGGGIIQVEPRCNMVIDASPDVSISSAISWPRLLAHI